MSLTIITGILTCFALDSEELKKYPVENNTPEVKKKKENPKKSMNEAIYMRSKLMPKQHIHSPNCEHMQFKID